MCSLTIRVKMLSIFSLWLTLSVAQIHDCGVDILKEDIAQKPSTKNQEEFEYKYQALVKAGNTLNIEDDMFVGLPIVFHVIHEGDSLGSVSNPRDKKIRALIQKTNNYFRQQNEERNTFENPFYGADTEISFCLANRDEDGNPSSGIKRYVSTNINTTYLLGLMWDVDKYINVFYLNEFAPGLCGAYSSGSDMIRMANRCISESLLAHELGHYLDLKHTFLIGEDCSNEDCTKQGDLVCDTPPKFAPSTAVLEGFEYQPCLYPANTCDTDEQDTSTHNPYRSIILGGVGDQEDPNSNIMGYAGTCRNNFTQGQAIRMQMNLLEKRKALWMQDSYCESDHEFLFDAGVDKIWYESEMDCNTDFELFISLKNLGKIVLNHATISVYNNENLVSNFKWQGDILPGKGQTVQLENVIPDVGRNHIVVSVDRPNSFQDEDSSSDINYLNVDVLNMGLDFDLHMTDTIVCSNQPLTLGILKNDSLANFNYIWRRANGLISSDLNMKSTLNVTESDTYFLTIYNNDNSCSIELSAKIEFAERILLDPLKILTNNSTITCNESSVLLKPNYILDSVTLKWYNKDAELGAGEEYLAMKAGEYRVEAIYETDQCEAFYESSDWYTVSETEKLDFELDTSGLLSCENSEVYVSSSLSDGDLDRYEYNWLIWKGFTIKADPQTHPFYFNNGDPRILKIDSDGIVKLEIIDRWTNCNSSEYLFVKKESNTKEVNIYTPSTFANPYIPFLLGAYPTFDAQEPILEWTASHGGEILEGGNTNRVIAHGTGLYTVHVKLDSSSCDVKTTLPIFPVNSLEYKAKCEIDDVTNEAIPFVEASISQSLARETSVPIDVLWYDKNGMPLFDQTDSKFLIYEPGNYSVEVFSENSTSSTIEELKITNDMFFVPEAIISAVDSIVCENDVTVLDGSNSKVGFNNTIFWKNGEGDILDDELLTSVSGAGTYTLQINNLANGCYSRATVELKDDFIEIDAGDYKVLNCPGDEIQLGEFEAKEGLTYEWFHVENRDTSLVGNFAQINAGEAGTYILKVFNENENCSVQDQVVVYDKDEFIKIEVVEGNVCSDSVLLLSIKNLENYFDYDLEWLLPDGSRQSIPQILAVEKGEYIARFLDRKTGCEQLDTFQFFDDFRIDFVLSESSLFAIPYKGNGPFTYLWNTFDEINEIDALHSGEVYHVTVTDQNNCSEIGTFQYLEAEPLEDEIESDAITINPNPTNGMVHIRHYKNDALDLNIKVYNATGREVSSATYLAVPLDVQFDFGTLPSGVYIFQVKTNESQTYHRVVLTR